MGDEQITPNESNGYEGIHAVVEVPAGGEVPIHVAYKSRGLDRWSYSFSDGITTVRNFSLKAVTDFSEYDFPPQTISASTKTPTKNGWTLEWTFNNLVSDFDIGVQMPTKLNPGPLASRMSYFAPVSLLFFGWMWGGMGLLLAIPILAVLRSALESNPATAQLGRWLGDD